MTRRPRRSESFRVTDERRHNFYTIDNEVPLIHGKQIGAYGLAVYNVLVMMARDKNVCWPSHNTIGDMIDLSRSSVIRSIDKLEVAGLIKIEKESPNGKRPHASNHYRILPVKKVYPTDTPSEPKVYQAETPVCHTGTEGVSEGNTNKTLKNNTKEEDKKPPPRKAITEMTLDERLAYDAELTRHEQLRDRYKGAV